MPTAGGDGGDGFPVTGAEINSSGSRRWGVAMLIAAAVLWSLNGLFIKALHEGGVHGVTIAGFRSLFACLVLTPFAAFRPRRIVQPIWLAGAVVAFTTMCATFVISTTMTTAANAIVLQYTAPVWVFLVAPFVTGERATRPQLWALAASLAGVVVIFAWQYQSGGIGLAVGLCSGVVFGVQSVLFRRVRANDPLVLTWLVCAGSAIALVAASMAWDRTHLTAGTIGWLALMGTVQFALPYVLFSWAIKYVSAQEGVLVVLLEAVLNPVWVWLVRGEVPHVSTLAGGGFILGSVVYLGIVQMRPLRASAEPRSRDRQSQ